MMNELDRFLSRVDCEHFGECCWWQGAKKSFRGYGKFWRDDGRQVAAHRYAYEAFVGPIPPGLVIDHLCKNKSCVNPAHLEAVTLGENTLRGDSITARNKAKTHCKRGHEFTPENTMPAGRDGNGRRCRICKRAGEARRYAARKAA